MTTVAVFGAFDGLHPGHAHFLAEAAAIGDRLVIILARDETIRRLKGHDPKFSFDDRAAALKLLPGVDEVLPGDDREGEYATLEAVGPDVIAFGYDQQALHDDCVAWLDRQKLPTHAVILEAFEPEKYKSSLLN